mmetsp:Transcript_66057/g.155520  ORF Transcript_66057/g.155520 Transcript_66057/m.155520 type:complete len:257 (+) Transcript_66057:503-1273(+)
MKKQKSRRASRRSRRGDCAEETSLRQLYPPRLGRRVDVGNIHKLRPDLHPPEVCERAKCARGVDDAGEGACCSRVRRQQNLQLVYGQRRRKQSRAHSFEAGGRQGRLKKFAARLNTAQLLRCLHLHGDGLGLQPAGQPGEVTGEPDTRSGAEGGEEGLGLLLVLYPSGSQPQATTAGPRDVRQEVLLCSLHRCQGLPEALGRRRCGQGHGAPRTCARSQKASGPSGAEAGRGDITSRHVVQGQKSYSAQRTKVGRY